MRSTSTSPQPWSRVAVLALAEIEVARLTVMDLGSLSRGL
jgi:hypothetical protein